jgi:hypothetical protein
MVVPMQSEVATVGILQQSAEEHRQLLVRARHTTGSEVDAVLNLGRAVLLHGILERSHIYAANQYLADAVVEQFTADHARLAADLGLLEELRQSDPESPDLVVLSGALLARLLEHLERDERTLYRPLERLGVAEKPRPARSGDAERED